MFVIAESNTANWANLLDILVAKRAFILYKTMKTYDDDKLAFSFLAEFHPLQ